MKNPTKDTYAQADKMKKAKATNKEIMAATGLSHSQLEIHLVHQEIANYGGYLTVPESVTAWVAGIAKLRTENQSWGVIACRFKVPESRIHRVFRESGVRSHGQRIGKGGRYIADDQRFYTGADRAKLGSELVTVKPIHDQLPEDYDAQPKRVLPTLAKNGKATAARKPRKATAKKG